MAPRKKAAAAPKDGVVMLAPTEPEGAEYTSVSTGVHGPFEVTDGKVTVPEEAVADLANAGFVREDGATPTGWVPPDEPEASTETVEDGTVVATDAESEDAGEDAGEGSPQTEE